MSRSGSNDYSDVYIVVKGKLIVKEDNDAKTRNKKLIFKNNAPFILCISKINNTTIGNADLDMLCLRIICYGIATIKEVCGIIIEIKKMMMPIKIMLLVTR